MSYQMCWAQSRSALAREPMFLGDRVCLHTLHTDVSSSLGQTPMGCCHHIDLVACGVGRALLPSAVMDRRLRAPGLSSRAGVPGEWPPFCCCPTAHQESPHLKKRCGLYSRMTRCQELWTKTKHELPVLSRGCSSTEWNLQYY